MEPMPAGRDAPIGMFDSGFGGLTVARAVIDLLPSEHLVYIGDTGRYPYGAKPAGDVRRYALELGRSLVDDFGAKAVVVACNTAASVALDELTAVLPVPVVGVVGPGARALVRATSTGRVAVIGTVGTVASRAYERAVSATGAPVSLVSAACPGFVEFVERDQTTGEEVTVLAQRLLAPVREAGVDALLLGCTHYPFLSGVIGEVMGPDVRLVSSADETAVAIRDALAGAAMLPSRSIALAGAAMLRDGGTGTHRFFSSGDVARFAELGRRLLGPELEGAAPWPQTGATKGE